jgi:hypothetical protein
MFDAAREGNADLLLAAIDAGLPPNLTNPKGTFSYVSYPIPLAPFRTLHKHKTFISLNSINHIFFLKENRQATRF